MTKKFETAKEDRIFLKPDDYRKIAQELIHKDNNSRCALYFLQAAGMNETEAEEFITTESKKDIENHLTSEPVFRDVEEKIQVFIELGRELEHDGKHTLAQYFKKEAETLREERKKEFEGESDGE